MESSSNSDRYKADKKSVGILFVIFLLAALFSLGVPRAGIAETPDAAAPSSKTKALDFEADKIQINDKNSSLELTGNVVITQGNTIITADQVTVFSKTDANSGLSMNEDAAGNLEDSIESITASGSVKIVSDDIIATADKAIYDLTEGSLVMTGQPAKIVKGLNTMSAPEIEYIGAL